MSKLGVRAVIENDGLYLLVRNKVSPDFWCLPGGGVESGEDILTAMERELLEELGIKPVIGNLLYVHMLKGDSGYDIPCFIFHIKNGVDFLAFDLAKTTHGKLELAEAKFMDVTITRLLPSFLKTELGELQKGQFAEPTRVQLTDFE